MVTSNGEESIVNEKRLWVAVACSVISALLAGRAPAQDSAAVERGKTLFGQTCSVCHGPDGHGVPNLGKDLVNSKFVAENTDAQLLEYVQKGRAANDPLNTTGIAMPARAGNPSLTDDQIRDIIAYIRTIVKK
jgi:disulfide bond formation protein DsbB